MKDFLAFAQERRSYRRFNSKRVPEELVADCLLAASFAPSAGDLQPWEFVICRSDSARSSVARACEHQDWILEAPVIVVVLGDVDRASAYHGDLGGQWCRDSCCAAVQNFLLAAQERELAACWVSAFDDRLLREALSFPEHMVPVALVALGYSDEMLIEKAVTPLDQVTFFEEYGRKLGLAFQIRDDLFDFGVEDVGKPIGIDLQEKKMTLPLIVALREADASERKRILKIVRQKRKSRDDVRTVARFVEERGGISYARDQMRDHAEDAARLLLTLPPTPARDALLDLSAYVVQRKK